LQAEARPSRQSGPPGRAPHPGRVFTPSSGYFELSQQRLGYTLKHILSDARWKLIDINVTTADLPK
jgi:hypothetical protein